MPVRIRRVRGCYRSRFIIPRKRHRSWDSLIVSPSTSMHECTAYCIPKGDTLAWHATLIYLPEDFVFPAHYRFTDWEHGIPEAARQAIDVIYEKVGVTRGVWCTGVVDVQPAREAPEQPGERSWIVWWLGLPLDLPIRVD